MTMLTDQLKEELKKFVSQQLQLVPNFSEEIESTTDYIVLLIANGRSAEETWTEVDELFSNENLKDVINRTYQALAEYQSSNSANSAAGAPAPAPGQAPVVLPSSSQSEQPPTSSSSALSGSESFREIDVDQQQQPQSAFGFQHNRKNNNTSRIQGGISKSLPSGPRSLAMKNAGAFQRAMDLSNGGGNRKKSRCVKFPHCPNKDTCIFAHPTRPCFNYPNCPNAPGTCSYLHPGEDDELMAELAKSKQEYREKKAQQQLKQSQLASGITLCKFGAVCANPQCPFGHPTVCNDDMKVTRLEWCSLNLKCEDPQCPKAHSSGSKIREVPKPTPPPTAPVAQPLINNTPNQPPAEKSLEQCKFGKFCTNRNCRFRHAKTLTMCREGEGCQRIDCLFNHPIAEDCRFGEGCKNPKCAFRHPNGKSSEMYDASSSSGSAPVGTVQNLIWTPQMASSTTERQFAVPEDQIMERIVKHDDGAIRQEPLQ
ncbi:hypothetical protein WICPIJ_001910 [Wickerhamomyces pijperi]|uniref:Uncharacterized protein n=1 Tax=Wickerhamomyces pijperi TaxID=599730 RepID=A0A9P8TPF6_WICPI|nr:hypothetical protein WICPIJ_001910 [Wickerhamomyces pijperi]